jgi:hypothetical protein
LPIIALALAAAFASAALAASPALAQSQRDGGGQAQASPPAADSSWGAFPPPEILSEFRRRLTEVKKAPAPSVSYMAVEESPPGKLVLTFGLESYEAAFVPLPQASQDLFRPDSVRLEGSDESLPLFLDRDSGTLWAYAPKGVGAITYSGRLKRGASLQLIFPREPRPKKVISRSKNWSAEGLGRGGALTSGSLYLTYSPDAADEGGGESAAGAEAAKDGGEGAGSAGGSAEAQEDGDGDGAGAKEDGAGSAEGAQEDGDGAGAQEDGAEAGSAEGAGGARADGAAAGGPEDGGGEAGGSGGPGALGGESVVSPFFMVRRTLSFGLEQKVFTSVSPIAPLDAPYTLSLPLLPGESPTTAGVNASAGRIFLNLSPQSPSFSWEGALSLPEGKITLTAESGPWTEVWVLDASTLWRVDAEGLSPVVSVSGSGWYNPEWRPWPGESAALSLSKPVPAPGRYLVADSGTLSIQAGKENRELRLSLMIRSSQGGNYSFSLPPGAEIRALELNGLSLPFQQVAAGGAAGPLVSAPLTPGEHILEVAWLEQTPFGFVTRAPELNLNIPAANIAFVMATPPDTWTLLAGGPQMGPAVLFWSFAAAVLVFSVFLSGLKLTPLRTISWFLFLLGLSQLSLVSGIIAAAWLLALGLRGRFAPLRPPWLFNAAQIVLIVWTAAALAIIYQGLTHALLESPQMYVTGNGSTEHNLLWFMDRTEGQLARPWAAAVPTRVYQYIMLAWALWLAISVIRWLRWGWRSFSEGAIWRRGEPRPKAPARPAPPRGPWWPPQGPPPVFAPGSPPYAPPAPEGPEPPPGPVSPPGAEAPQQPPEPPAPEGAEPPQKPSEPPAPDSPEGPEPPDKGPEGGGGREG